MTGADWTPEDVAYIEANHPEFIAEPVPGRRVVTISRREAENLASQYPTMLKAAPPVPVAGDTAERAALRARYCNSPSMFKGAVG